MTEQTSPTKEATSSRSTKRRKLWIEKAERRTVEEFLGRDTNISETLRRTVEAIIDQECKRIDSVVDKLNYAKDIMDEIHEIDKRQRQALKEQDVKLHAINEGIRELGEAQRDQRETLDKIIANLHRMQGSFMFRQDW